MIFLSRRDRWTAALGVGGCAFGAIFEWAGPWLPQAVILGAGVLAILLFNGVLALLLLGAGAELRAACRRDRNS